MVGLGAGRKFVEAGAAARGKLVIFCGRVLALLMICVVSANDRSGGEAVERAVE